MEGRPTGFIGRDHLRGATGLARRSLRPSSSDGYHRFRVRPAPSNRETSSPLLHPGTSIQLTSFLKDLATASHVFLRQGPFRGALQAPYTGAHKVRPRNDKTNTEVYGAATRVSIDRLKQAFLLHADTDPAAPSSTTLGTVAFPDGDFAFRRV